MIANLFSFLLPLFGGFLYALGFPSFFNPESPLPFAPLLPMVGVYFLLKNFPLPTLLPNSNSYSLKRAVIALLLFSMGFNLTGFYWVPETIKVFGQIPSPFHYFIGLLFSLFILPQYWAILFFLHLAFLWQEKTGKYVGAVLPLSSLHILLALIFTLGEYYVPQQFPAHLGHSWLILAPRLCLAPYFGAPLFSFISFLLPLGLMSWRESGKKDFWGPTYAVILIVINLICSLPSHPTSAGTSGNPEITIRVVQANIGNFLKVDAEKGDKNSIQNIFKLYYNLSIDPSSKADLIIWPETAYPHSMELDYLREDKKNVPNIFQEIQKSMPDSEILFGGYEEKKGTKFFKSYYETLYNVAFFLDKDGLIQGTYQKHLLIPFGETLPFGPLNSFLSKYVDNISYFSRGNSFQVFQTKNQARFVVAICYELLFSQYIRKMLMQARPRPQFLVNLTNDSWYGDTAEPYQHLFLAKWRALEFQIPVIRSTNTGITSVIYPDGSEGPRLGINQTGKLDLKLPVRKPVITFFQQWGIGGLMLLTSTLFFLSFFLSGGPFKKFKGSWKESLP